MNVLAALLTALLVLGVPAGIAWAVWHHRTRDRQCREVARRAGLRYQSRTDGLCDPELAALERFLACSADLATAPDFRCIFSRIQEDGGTAAAHVFDY